MASYARAMHALTKAKLNTAAGTSKPKSNKFGLMANHSLSKCTDVSVQGMYQNLSGGTTGTTLDTAFIRGSRSVVQASDRRCAATGDVSSVLQGSPRMCACDLQVA